MPSADRRPFPGPWTVRKTARGFVIDDATKRPVAFVCYVEGFRSALEYGKLSEEEAQTIAAAITRLPDHGLI